MTDVEMQRLRRRNLREREARKLAENLLEQKSLELYSANRRLQNFTEQLEDQVRERTHNLQAALAEALAARQAKSDFLAVMSHEIRTSLNGILGTLDLVDRKALSAEYVTYIEVIRRSGDHLLQLINDVLDFSKIEAGQMRITPDSLPIGQELEHLAILFRPIAEAKGVALKLEVSNKLPKYVRADGLRLRQILSNLLSNALKFTAQGEVGLRLEIISGESPGPFKLRFSVTDTGIGIAPEALARLFQPFTQAEPGTVTKYGGTGLGLAISAQLVTAMGGHIKVESSPGSGTVFYFDITVEECGSAPDLHNDEGIDQTKDSQTKLPASGSLRILLAEDNSTNQILGQAILRKLGFLVDIAANGEEAVRLAEHKNYHLILMDMQMPVMDGIEAARTIRSLPLPQQPRIVALTANAFDHYRDACMNAGMDEFLTKPLNIKRIQEELCKTANFFNI